MKPGFTLIELLIAMVVSSMLALVLYGALWQISRQSGWFDDRISVGMRAAVSMHQLERDISGACVPLSELREAPAKNKKKEEKKKDEREPLEKIFYSENKNKQLHTLTCITNNPLPDPKGKTPRSVRVMYRIEPENKEKTSFKLVRQESVDLDSDVLRKNNKLPRDTLITGIQTITTSFSVTAKKEDKIEEKKFKEWLGKDELQQEKIIPQAVTITLTLWARDKKRTKEFKTTILIPGYAQVHKEKEQKQTQKKQPAFAGMKKEDLEKMKKILESAKGTS